MNSTKAIVVELEVLSFFLGEVGQVEADADKVRLRRVVALMLVIIDDHKVTLILSGCDVLEVIEVEWVGQDVIRVNTLESLALGLRHGLQTLILRVCKDL